MGPTKHGAKKTQSGKEIEPNRGAAKRSPPDGQDVRPACCAARAISRHLLFLLDNAASRGGNVAVARWRAECIRIQLLVPEHCCRSQAHRSHQRQPRGDSSYAKALA